MISQLPRCISRTLALLVCVVFVGCASRVPPAVESPLRTVPPGEWPALVDELDPEGLIAATEHSLAFFDVLPQDRVFTFGSEERTAGQLAAGARRFIQLVRDETDPERFLQVIVNVEGTVFDIRDGDSKWNAPFEHKVAPADHGWQLEVALPFSLSIFFIP